MGDDACGEVSGDDGGEADGDAGDDVFELGGNVNGNVDRLGPARQFATDSELCRGRS